MDEVVSTLSSFLFGAVVCDLILHISNARLKRKKTVKEKKKVLSMERTVLEFANNLIKTEFTKKNEIPRKKSSVIVIVFE